MDAISSKGKQTLEEKVNKYGIIEEDIDDDLEEEESGVELSFVGEEKKKKGNVVSGRRGSGGGGGGGGVSPPCCQAEKCGADLTDAKRYHRRHKVCEFHAKALVVIIASQPGLWQRFCQQCSRFHELSEFDEAKRSCRRRLAGHNERRRKSAAEYYGEGSSRKGAGQCKQVEERGRVQISLPGNPTYKHYHIK